MAPRYVYAKRGILFHHTSDGLRPLCRARLTGAFIAADVWPVGRARCERCTIRQEKVDALAFRARVRDSEIVTLLAQGLTDQAVSRRLGWAARTRVRYFGEAMTRAGAKTRFQWGFITGRAHERLFGPR